MPVNGTISRNPAVCMTAPTMSPIRERHKTQLIWSSKRQVKANRVAPPLLTHGTINSRSQHRRQKAITAVTTVQLVAMVPVTPRQARSRSNKRERLFSYNSLSNGCAETHLRFFCSCSVELAPTRTEVTPF